MASPILPVRAHTKRRKKLYPRLGEAPNSPSHLLRRIANDIQISPETGCWEWRGSDNGQGYGHIFLHNRGQVYTHRLIWELIYGKLQPGVCVLHRCDNPPCCNPSHLFTGTLKDNSQDAARKGRLRGPRFAATPGESHPMSKLTDVKVLEIYRRAHLGETCASLGREFECSPTLVSLIRRRKRWTHILPKKDSE